MKNKLSKFSDRELLDELASRGNNFVGSSSGTYYNMPSNFLELSFDGIYEMTSGDEDVTEEFFFEHFDEVYESVDWNDVQLRAFIYVIDFISLTLRNKFNESNPYNDEVWEVEIDSK
jgi:hypothetical protein